MDPGVINLPAVIVALTTWLAAWIGSRRVLAVTPLQAVSGSVPLATDEVGARRGKHAVAGILFALGAVALAAGILLGLVSPLGVVVAFYHSGVEWKIFPPPTGCTGGGEIDLMNMDSLDRPMTVPSCTDAPFYILGLSMAGWNGVVSAVLAAASFISAGATFRGRNEA